MIHINDLLGAVPDAISDNPWVVDARRALVEAQRRLSESKLDAERYRFLRDGEYPETLLGWLVIPGAHRTTVNSAIDAAMKVAQVAPKDPEIEAAVAGLRAGFKQTCAWPTCDCVLPPGSPQCPHLEAK